MTVTGPGIRTIDELLEAAEIDLEEWEIIPPVTLNAWGSGESQQFQVKIKLKRKVTEALSKGIEHLLEGLKSGGPKRVLKPRVDNGCLLVFGITDLHAGLLAWAPETGGENYDLAIAKTVFHNAVDDILASVQHHEIEQATLIIGSDLFHSNDSRNRTFAGTPLDVDGRHAKVFAEVCQMLIEGVSRIGEVCPVYCPLISGNHDTEVAFFASQVLSAYFHDDQFVTVDTRPTLRKYQSFGANLIGYTHGHDVKLESLPLIMATEAADAWSRCPYREIMTGHVHRAREMRFMALDETNGVRIRVNPSLCSADAWHSSKGYCGSRRAAEGHVYDAEQGYISTVEVKARA